VLHLFAPYAVRVVVDKIAAGTLTLKDLLFWTSVNLVVAGVKYGLGYLWRIQLYGASGRLGRLLRDRLFAHFVRMSPSFFHQRRTGDLMAHATNDIQAIVDTAGDGVLTLADSIIWLCGRLHDGGVHRLETDVGFPVADAAHGMGNREIRELDAPALSQGAGGVFFIE
jgi:ABC-type multidrug transport system fused ATPase/permease subunit